MRHVETTSRMLRAAVGLALALAVVAASSCAGHTGGAGTAAVTRGSRPTRSRTTDGQTSASGWVGTYPSGIPFDGPTGTTTSDTHVPYVPTPPDDPYAGTGYTVLRTAADLEQMRRNPSGRYALGCDIDLQAVEWTPIGNDAAPFTGELQGDGFTIKNVKITKKASGCEAGGGLFGNAEGSTICNLSVEGSYRAPGGLAGIAGKAGTLECCAFRGTIESLPDGGASFATAGLCVQGELIRDCRFDGTLRGGGDSLCGIAARAGSIIFCRAYGELIITQGTNLCAAGIGDTAEFLYGCVNAANISESPGASALLLTGVVNRVTSITASANHGDFLLHTPTVSVRGVANVADTVDSCYNTGDVSGGLFNYAGIVADAVTVSGCYNAGTLIGSAGLRYAGSIACMEDVRVINCHTLAHRFPLADDGRVYRFAKQTEYARTADMASIAKILGPQYTDVPGDTPVLDWERAYSSDSIIASPQTDSDDAYVFPPRLLP